MESTSKHLLNTYFMEPSAFIMFLNRFIHVFVSICHPSVHPKRNLKNYKIGIGKSLEKSKEKCSKNCVVAHTNKLENSIDVSGPYFQESLQLLILTVEEKMLDASSDSRSLGRLMSDMHLNSRRGVCVER